MEGKYEWMGGLGVREVNISTGGELPTLRTARYRSGSCDFY